MLSVEVWQGQVLTILSRTNTILPLLWEAGRGPPV